MKHVLQLLVAGFAMTWVYLIACRLINYYAEWRGRDHAGCLVCDRYLPRGGKTQWSLREDPGFVDNLWKYQDPKKTYPTYCIGYLCSVCAARLELKAKLNNIVIKRKGSETS
jgi:hypothetical protein